MRRHAAIAILFPAAVSFLVAACTTVGHQRVEGWPRLAVYEHYVPHHEMRDRCVKYAPFGTTPEACAEFNLVERRCDIWFSADFPPQEAIVKHERMHCEGYDHVGSTGMRDYLARYNDEQQRIASMNAGAGATSRR